MSNDFFQRKELRAYAIRAIYDWCEDNSYSTYIKVVPDRYTVLPLSCVVDGMATFDISDNVKDLVISNKSCSFVTRVGNDVVEIFIPINRIISVYAFELADGYIFEILETQAADLEIAGNASHKSTNSNQSQLSSNAKSNLNDDSHVDEASSSSSKNKPPSFLKILE